MAIYKETKDYKLIHDNMLNMGDYIADGTIDCIITDPPYELGFIGWMIFGCIVILGLVAFIMICMGVLLI